MSRPKSSSLALINDLAKSLISEVDNAIAEHDILQADSKRLKEIEPALKKLQYTLNPPTIDETLRATDNNVPPPDNLPPDDHPTRKRTKYIRMKLLEGGNNKGDTNQSKETPPE